MNLRYVKSILWRFTTIISISIPIFLNYQKIFTNKHNIKCCAPRFHYHSQDNNYNTSWSAPKIDDSLHRAIPNSQLINKDNRHYSENFTPISSISHAEFHAYTRVRNVPKTRTQKERSWDRGRHLLGAARFLERFVTFVGGIKSDIKLGARIWTIFLNEDRLPIISGRGCCEPGTKHTKKRGRLEEKIFFFFFFLEVTEDFWMVLPFTSSSSIVVLLSVDSFTWEPSPFFVMMLRPGARRAFQ